MSLSVVAARVVFAYPASFDDHPGDSPKEIAIASALFSASLASLMLLASYTRLGRHPIATSSTLLGLGGVASFCQFTLMQINDEWSGKKIDGLTNTDIKREFVFPTPKKWAEMDASASRQLLIARPLMRGLMMGALLLSLKNIYRLISNRHLVPLGKPLIWQGMILLAGGLELTIWNCCLPESEATARAKTELPEGEDIYNPGWRRN